MVRHIDDSREPDRRGETATRFDRRYVVVGIARRDDEESVDVGGRELGGLAALRSALQHRPACKATVQNLVARVGQHPVADAVIAGFGVNRKAQLDHAALRQSGQAGAVDRGDPPRSEARVGRPELILEKGRTSKAGERFGETERAVHDWGRRCGHG